MGMLPGGTGAHLKAIYHVKGHSVTLKEIQYLCLLHRPVYVIFIWLWEQTISCGLVCTMLRRFYASGLKSDFSNGHMAN
jgi:hypothetical protein